MARHSWSGFALAVCLVARASRATESAPTDEELASGVSSDRLVQAALARNPGLLAAAERARATHRMASAEGTLPDPEAMAEVWQVPFARPASLRESQMISFGVRQTFPAPGAQRARAESRAHAASAEEAMLADRRRDLTRDVEHAIADLSEAMARHETHMEHSAIATRIVRAAEARQAAGGSLADVAQAKLDLAELDAEVASEAANIDRAFARLNGLLARPFDAQLSLTMEDDVATVSIPSAALVELASRSRPELRAAEARLEAERSMVRALRREETWPSFSAGARYFAPTAIMPEHGYGIEASATLPWFWGERSHKRAAEEALVRASGFDEAEVRYRINVEVGSAAATARAAEARWRALSSGALPAADRAFEVTNAAYGANQGDLLSLLRAERSVVDVEDDLARARAALEHALAELDWAVGVRLPRTPLRKGSTP